MNNKKAVWGWGIYDWANSAFATTIMAGFFPIFFKEYWSIGTDLNMSTAKLGFANSVASLFVALAAPVLGSIADRGTARKKFLVFFAYLGVLMTACLYTVDRGQWGLAILFYVIGVVGFSGANIFYDSLLPLVAEDHNSDYISSLGYSLGYLGGGILFLINVVIVLHPEILGLQDATQAVRLSFVSVALWWGGFTIFTIIWVKEKKSENNDEKNGENCVVQGFRQLYNTFKKIRRLKTILLFLMAYWFYIDGVGTIIRMAVDYGISLGFDSNDLIVALLITQFVGFPSALVFGKLGQEWDTRKSIFLSIGVYVIITIWGVFITSKFDFYMLAVAIGLVQGGIQSLSRSYYSRMIPENQSAEYFGFYNMLGKFAAILGPTLMGVVGVMVRKMLMPESPTAIEITNVEKLASRTGMASIVLLFLTGAVFLYFVKDGNSSSRRLN